jgi:hypothetical protein
VILAGHFPPSEPRQKETRNVEFDSLLSIKRVVERVSRVDHLRDEVVDAPFERRHHLLRRGRAGTDAYASAATAV